jgi:two-component sensor histidine kinase
LLSTTVEPDVPFDDIADRLLVMVTDLAMDPNGPAIATSREGSFGSLDVDLATPLALVLAELVQNAVEHGLAGGGGTVVLRPEPAGRQLSVLVDDDGAGLPSGFDQAESTGLGLQIARMLVADLGGEVVLMPGENGGTRAAVRLPLEPN